MEGSNTVCVKCNICVEDDYYQCDVCTKKLHQKCAGLSSTEAKSMPLQKRILVFACDECVPILKRLPTLLLLMESINQKLVNMEQRVGNVNENKVGYNEIVKKNLEEIIVVKPKDISQESVQTKQIIQEKINPSLLGVGVTRMKYIKQGGVAISCNKNQETKNVYKEMKEQLGQEYEIKIPEKKNPKLKIINIDRKLLEDEEELVEKLVLQNSIRTPKDELIIKLINTYENKRGKTCVILEVDKVTYEQIKKRDVLYVGWNTCKYMDYINVIQCFCCWKFGHIAKECRSKKIVCPKCAQNHKVEDCQQSEEICINCKYAVEVLKLTNVEFHHYATDKNCEAYKRVYNEIQKRIDYPELFNTKK